MSCWVVPLVAAEYWRVSLEHVHARIRAGSVPTRVENGFTFVDVLPAAATAALSGASPATPPPPTYVAVSQAELEALAADGATAEPPDGEADELEYTVDADEFTPDGSGGLPRISWSGARTHAARLRVAPRRLAA